jgi:hypothetical protein
VDNRIDWLKNTLWDTVELYYVAQAAIIAGDTDPEHWLRLEKLLGNLSELMVDWEENGIEWTYCPTSYNPVSLLDFVSRFDFWLYDPEAVSCSNNHS